MRYAASIAGAAGAARSAKLRDDAAYGALCAGREAPIRLRVVEITLPALRERPGDIPILVDGLLGKINRDLGKDVRYVTPAALARSVARDSNESGGRGPVGSAGGQGGNGFAGAVQATGGQSVGSNRGGGGGGGAGGYIQSNLALTGATVSAGDTRP